MALSLSKVEGIAPDQRSLAAAKKLLKASGWPSLCDDGAGIVWGECQGSGSSPYRVCITEADADIGYKCTCPSRKFPCTVMRMIPSKGLDRAFPSRIGSTLGPASLAVMAISGIVAQFATGQALAVAGLIAMISGITLATAIQLRGNNGRKSIFVI